MDEKWTEDQLKVLEAKDSNVLVSAAAGSGKTSVLIERIIRMISDREHPLDVDRLLVVTFTEAAAGEMRSRLRRAITQKIESDPGDARLHRQLLLLPRARVSTIHSFCTWLLRNYFHAIDLDPGFRVGDEEEMALIRTDVLKEVLEEEYRKGEENFIDFTETVSARKTDEKAEELIQSLYKFSQSAPYPKEWLDQCLLPYQISTPEELEKESWFQSSVRQRGQLLRQIAEGYDRILALCRADGGPAVCLEDFTEEQRSIRFAGEAGSYEEMRGRMALVSFPRKKNPPKTVFSLPELNERVKKLREAQKKKFTDLQKKMRSPIQDILSEIRETRWEAEELVRLTKLFTEAFRQEKKRKNLVDFNDLEHFAIGILRNPDHSRSEIAKTLSRQFSEIMIDEYQDSNMVQEEILTAVSGTEEGRNNMFMVGDMKQSIYRFRMARPELFMSKYESFSRGAGPSRKIELHANFRSRREVVDSVNFFFRQLMHREAGGIEYDDDAALRAEARFPEEPGADYGTELLLIRRESAGEPDEAGGPDAPESGEEDMSLPDKELEIHAAAREILRITDPETGLLLSDKSGGHHRARFKDIVLLSRSLTGYETLVPEIFLSYGIPVYANSRTGYFSTWEVRLMLNLIRVIDNPIQDIPLAAVLRSPLFGFSSEELAVIRSGCLPAEEGNGFYGALKRFSGRELPGQEALRERVREFLRRMEGYREKARVMTVSALIRFLLSDLNIDIFVSAMKGGAQRMDNLIALLSKAETFEKSSYHGLYHFVRYMARLESASIDEGETNSLSENDNVVRLMTVHASKGLEFPVVFVTGISRRINIQDEKGIAVFHPDHGIGLDLVNARTRVRRKTLIREAFRDCIHSESFGEELRILYVAMTRAEQKLYLCGLCPKNFRADELAEVWDSGERPLSPAEILSASGWLGWLLEAYRNGCPVKLRLLTPGPASEAAGAEEGEGGAETPEKDTEELFRSLAESAEGGGEFYRQLDGVLSFPYLYDDLYRVRSTMSVSLLKALARQEEGAGDLREAEEGALVNDIPGGPEREGTGPRGKSAEEGRREAAAYGTMVHGILERMIPGEEPGEALGRLMREGRISPEEAASVNPRKLGLFYRSELGARCIRAHERGKLYREKSFIIGLPLSELLPGIRVRDAEAGLQMIQGIIDLWFEEEDGLVLVDYKTDRVRKPEELTARYGVQLRLYARALTQSSGRPVKEMWIWSYSLGCAVRL